MKEINSFEQLESFVGDYLDEFSTTIGTKLRHRRLDVIDNMIRRELMSLKKWRSRPQEQHLFDLLANSINRMEATIAEHGKALNAYKMPELICDLAENVDKSITLEQEEERFKPTEADEGFRKVIKLSKRGLKALNQVGVWLEDLFRKEKKNRAVWKQHIPLRTILCYFQARMDDTYLEWLSSDLELYHKTTTGMLQHLKKWQTESEGKTHSEYEPQQDELADALQTFLEEMQCEIEYQQQGLTASSAQAAKKQKEQIIPVLHKAGTIECSPNKFFIREAPELLQSLNKKLETTLKSYLDTACQILHTMQAFIEISEFGTGIKQRAAKAEKAVINLIDNSSLSKINLLIKELSATNDNLNEIKNLKEESGRFEQFFEEQVLNALEQEIQQNRYRELADDLANDIMMRISQLPLEYTEISIEKQKYRLNVEKRVYQLNKLVARFFKEEVIRALQKQIASTDEKFKALEQEIRQALDIIEINLDAAEEARETGTGSESPEQIARKGLLKGRDILEQAQQKVNELYQTILGLVKDNIYEAYEKLFTYFREERLDDLKWMDKGYQIRGQALDWNTKFEIGWARVEDYFSARYRLAAKIAGQWYAYIAPWLGLPQQQTPSSQKSHTTAYLSELTQKIEKLPFIYRNLFDTTRLADERFYLNHPSAKTQLKKAIEQWEQNLHANFAVVGERGSGKTSFFHDNLKSGKYKTLTIPFNDTIYRKDDLLQKLSEAMELDKSSTVEEFINQINEMEERQIIVLEDLQNVYLRDMHGFDAMEALLLILTQTTGKCFWAVSASRYAWAYLNKVINLSDYFSYVSVCDTFTVDQVKQLVLTRHRASGYDLVFEPSDEIKNSRTFKKHLGNHEEVQAYLEQQFFNELSKIAEGNPSIALMFWLRSIKEFDEEKIVIIPFTVAAFDTVENTTPEILFTLATLILHDTLTPEQLSIALNQDVQKSRLNLLRLHSKGILKELNNNFTVNLLMYRQILHLLKQHNIIHLTEV